MTRLRALERKRPAYDQTNWVTAFFMAVFHIGAVAALFFFTWKAVFIAIFLWWVSGSFGIGMGYHRVYGDRDEHPPGWGHGKKTGWGNCGLPPGQAKKHGCRTYVYQGRPHYYYQDDHGRMIVRRPIIDVHGSVDIVH